jgi:hypothetical protein
MRVKVYIKDRKCIVRAGGTMSSKISMKIKIIIGNKFKIWIDPINIMQTIEILINFKKPKNKKSQLLNFKATYF